MKLIPKLLHSPDYEQGLGCLAVANEPLHSKVVGG
jgi:hypothetical protein